MKRFRAILDNRDTFDLEADDVFGATVKAHRQKPRLRNLVRVVELDDAGNVVA